MEASQVVLVVAVALGIGSIAWGRSTRRRLPLLCGMGMIASTCLLLGRYRYPVAALVLAGWVVGLLAAALWTWRVSRVRSAAGAPSSDP